MAAMKTTRDPSPHEIRDYLAQRLRRSPLWASERATRSFVLMLEAMSSPETVIDAILDELEIMDPDALVAWAITQSFFVASLIPFRTADLAGLAEFVSGFVRSGGLHHPLKYADIEACLPGAGSRRVYLSVQFRGQPSSDLPEHRDRHHGPDSREYRQLARVHYHPEPSRVPTEDTPPWSNDDDPTVVFVEVWPVQRDLTQWLPNLRAFLTKLLRANVDGIAPKGLDGSRFLLHFGLLPETSEIEVGTTSWTELRRNREAVHAVAVP